MPLPETFIQRLQDIFPAEDAGGLQDQFRDNGGFAVRINTLKADPAGLRGRLAEEGPAFFPAAPISEALIFEQQRRKDILDHPLTKEGVLYPQSLSSQLVSRILDPKRDERILDLCAAPGSKTSHIAAMMKNTGEIIAVDAVRKRVYKLQSVLRLLGVTNTVVRCLDGRRCRDDKMFDRILVDAPCSAEARFKPDKPKSYAFWSERKIREMARKQKGLLLNAGRLLLPGGVLVYATCTFAPEENEAVIDWLLRKTGGQMAVEPVDAGEIGRLPPVEKWKEKTFAAEVKDCLRIRPGGGWEGFFIAKMRKQK